MPDCLLLTLRDLFALGFLIFSLVPFFPGTVSIASPRSKRAQLWNMTSTDRLKKDLLTGYDKFARPTNHSKLTPVDFNFDVAHVHIDEAKFMMYLNVFITLVWEDDKLKWNPDDYEGITKLHVADHEVWDPDIYVMNSAAGNNIGNAICIVHNNGRVEWHPPAQFSTFCELDFSKWPFDRHTCMLSVGSYSYYSEVNLTAANNPVLEKWTVGSGWRILTIKKAIMDITVTYSVVVERYGSAYISSLVLPTLALILVTLSTFWLPPRTHERFLLSSVSVVLLSLNLAFTSQKLPVMGSNTPFIVVFTTIHLFLAGISVIVSVINHNLSAATSPVPWLIQTLVKSRVTSYLGLPICKGDYTEETMTGEEMQGYGYETGQDDQRILDRSPLQTTRMWTALVIIVDRLAFLLYAIIFLCLGFTALC